MPTATPCCSLRQRNIPTDSRYPTVNQHSLSHLVKVKEVSGETSNNGTLYVGLSESECVVICAISPTMINNNEAIICNPFLNKGYYGIACRSATYPHNDASLLEVSLKVYYMSLHM